MLFSRLFRWSFILPLSQSTYRYHGDGTTLWDFVSTQPELSTLASWIRDVEGLELAFDSIPHRTYTFFAPSNDALAAVSQNLIYHYESPGGKRTMLYNIYYHYVANDKIMLSDFNGTYQHVQTASYAYLGIQDVGGEKMLNKIGRVVEGNLEVTNGVVHIVDKLLNPTTSHYENDREVPKFPAWQIPAAGWEVYRVLECRRDSKETFS